MARQEAPELLTVREAFSLLNVDDLKTLLALAGLPKVTRKAELIDQLAATLESPTQLRNLYDGLDELAKKAIQEAAHDPLGVWHRERFSAKYGNCPSLNTPGRDQFETKPTVLRLFFPRGTVLATDLRASLRSFVLRPPRLTISGRDELPATIRRPHHALGRYYREPNPEEVELRVRETARPALLDVKAVLRLIDAGVVKVGEKTRRPSQATLGAVAAVLSEGDFYEADDYSEFEQDPAADLTMKPFAWPLLLQAAGLAGTTGSKVQLTPAGRKATTQPPHEAIRQAWNKWLKTTLYDEFNRVDAIKGQQTKGSLTAVAPRRQTVADLLKDCPVGRWVSIEEFFRFAKASQGGFAVARDDWKLYIGMQQYGSLGYTCQFPWEQLQGRFALALLFEYAATLGLVDVAYISPVNARNDYRDRWGTDDLYCLSRYDGLMFFRINSLGAWCLGLVGSYEAQAATVEDVLKVLPNLDIVATDERPSASDVLFLDRFAERRSESVWHLSRDKVLTAVEQGLAVGELRDFLVSKSSEALPQTADVCLSDLEERAAQLSDLGTARLIACKDAILAHTLANDRRLRGSCQLAGERHLVFAASDEAAVRKALKELGHVLPPPK